MYRKTILKLFGGKLRARVSLNYLHIPPFKFHEVSVSMTMNGAVFTVMEIYIRAAVEKHMELGTEGRKYS